MISLFTTFRAALAATVASASLLAACPAFAGVIEAAEFRSAALERPLTFNVYLPTGYETNARVRYPVLYLLHGNAGTRNDWAVKGNMQRTVDALIEKGDIPPAVIVMPDAGTTWFVDLKEKMETAFMNELLPHVEKSYRVLTTRDGRLIGGLSMGGYGALRFALKYPEKFQAAALLSPAIYNPEPPIDSSARFVKVFAQQGSDGAYSVDVWKANNYPALWDAYLQKKMPVAMYINSGDDDEFMIESEATQLYTLLRKNKQSAELRIVNGKHEWAVWEESLGEALKYIFRSARRPQAQ